MLQDRGAGGGVSSAHVLSPTHAWSTQVGAEQEQYASFMHAPTRTHCPSTQTSDAAQSALRVHEGIAAHAPAAHVSPAAQSPSDWQPADFNPRHPMTAQLGSGAHAPSEEHD
jgi:hypothetical protein